MCILNLNWCVAEYTHDKFNHLNISGYNHTLCIEFITKLHCLKYNFPMVRNNTIVKSKTNELCRHYSDGDVESCANYILRIKDKIINLIKNKSQALLIGTEKTLINSKEHFLQQIAQWSYKHPNNKKVMISYMKNNRPIILRNK